MSSPESKQPWDILQYALRQYAPNIILACSFGAEDVALIDMIHRIDPKTALFYLDTDFLFPETHDVKRRLGDRYGLQPTQLLQIKSLLTPEQQAVQHGEACGRAIPTVVVIFAKSNHSLAHSNSMPHGSQAFAVIRRRPGRTPGWSNGIVSSNSSK